MKNNISSKITKKLLFTATVLMAIVIIGTTGYSIIGKGQNLEPLDCLYMTVVTISTIGYREVIDLSGNPAGKIFTMFLAFSGIGILTYVFSAFAAFAVEGTLKKTFRRKKMEKMINKLNNHLIICGAERVGFHIANELLATNRPFVIIEQNESYIQKILEAFPNTLYLEGDATDDNILLKAGIEKAYGLFATMENDHKNLVISLSAKQLNPQIKIIADTHDLANIEKIKKAGANRVISPTSIGGLRMVSEMIRPAAVSFLDIMLRDKDKNLRVEDIPATKKIEGEKISSLNLKKYTNTLLLAVKTESTWNYNPQDSYTVQQNDILVVMTTPEERKKILNEIQ